MDGQIDISIFSEEIQKIIPVVSEAGDVLLNLFHDRTAMQYDKKGVADLVTEADVRSEKLIVEKLAALFPSDKIVSEEKDFDEEHRRQTEKRVWVVDPLDGTRNFSIGNPNFVISVGLVKDAVPIAGIIYYPILSQYFIADNYTAYLNVCAIRIDSGKKLKDAIAGFWDKREKDPNYEKADISNSLRGKVKVLRMFGASALEKAWVANNQLDLFIGNSSSIFGAAAAVPLVRYADGVALNLEGRQWEMGDVGIICGEKELVEEALGCLR